MSNNQGQTALPFYLATLNKRSVGIKRDESYENTIKLIKKSFYELDDIELSKIHVSTKFADYEDVLAEVSQEIWSDLVAQISAIQVNIYDTQRPTAVLQDDQPEDNDDPVPASILNIPSTFEVIVRTPTLRGVRIDGVFSEMTIRTLKWMIECKCSIPAASQSLKYNSRLLEHDHYMMTNYGIGSGSLIVIA